MSAAQEVVISEELKRDPNYRAYTEAESTGLFHDLSLGTWVAFLEGELVATAETFDALLKAVGPRTASEVIFVSQVGIV